MAAVLSFMLGALSISGILVKLFLVVVDILLGRIWRKQTFALLKSIQFQKRQKKIGRTCILLFSSIADIFLFT